jgi:hypothetical protein
LTGLVVLLACAFIAFLLQPKTDEGVERVTILSGPFGLPMSPRDRFAMTFGWNRPWVARAERAFFGKRKSVTISADIIQVSATAFTNLESALNPGMPPFKTNTLNMVFE